MENRPFLNMPVYSYLAMRMRPADYAVKGPVRLSVHQ